MTTEFDTVQRIVLHGTVWEAARHVVLRFPPQSSAPHFLAKLEKKGYWPTAARWSDQPGQPPPDLQVSLGFSRRGLKHARVPDHVLSLFALKSPAFHAGAALRAAAHLGATGGDPRDWEKSPFRFTTLDAVLSVHGANAGAVDKAVSAVYEIACDAKVHTHQALAACRLPTPKDEKDVPGEKAMWTHFGFRDGVSRVGIDGWTLQAEMDKYEKGSRHKAGEFILGHPQDSGANPWIAGPDGRVWPQEFRDFFRNGSFGVLHQIRQHVEEFERFVKNCAEQDWARNHGLDVAAIKAKLCGRYTDGRPIVAAQANPMDDFSYEADPEGCLCPFGAHARRMNPRGSNLAHSVRQRPLLRRGLPYGRAENEERGLMGQFFCASIEEQFEHLVGQWADRVPLGSGDAGGARDPMFGAHAPGDGAFLIPQKGGTPIQLTGMTAFARTVGLAYLFYPSLTTLEGIRDGRPWRPDDEDEDEEDG